MDNIMKKLEKTLVPFGSKLATNNVLSSIRDGIAAVMPIIMVGSLALIIKNFPTATDPTKDKWAQFLAGDGQGFADFLVKIWYASFGIMALVSVFGIAYNYAQRKGVDGFSSAVIALASYIVTLPLAVTQLDKKTFSTGIDFGQLGSNGLFGAILVGVISSVIFTFFVKHKITIKMPDTVPPAVANSFMALIPGFVILVFWNLVATLLAKTDLHSINNMMETLLGKPLESFGGSLIGVIVVATLTSLFWFVGVHGGNITGAIMGPIYLNMMANNLKNYQAHKFLENIVTTPFMDMFVYLGGGGATLGLVIVLTLFAKSKQNKTMKPLVMVPGLFNINEPTMFGLPVVLNVYLIIPFVVVPIVNALISYISMASGLVARTTGVAVPWTMPPIISGFLATSSWTGAVLQVVLIIVDVLIWFPFFKIFDKRELAIEASEDADTTQIEENI